MKRSSGLTYITFSNNYSNFRCAPSLSAVRGRVLAMPSILCVQLSALRQLKDWPSRGSYGFRGGGAVEVAALGSVMLAFVYPIGCRLSLSSSSHRSVHIDICDHSNACLFRPAWQLQLLLHSAILKTCSRSVNVAVIDRDVELFAAFSVMGFDMCLVTYDLYWLAGIPPTWPVASPSICASFSFTSYSQCVLFAEPGFPNYWLVDHQSHRRRAALCTWRSLP